jgi:hypothetical protein
MTSLLATHATAALLLSALLGAADDVPLLPDGGMEDQPAWKTSGGSATIARDAERKHGGKASMRIELAAGPCTAQHVLARTGSDSITVSGFLFLEGAITARVPVRVFDAEWRQVAWIELLPETKASVGWVPFSGTAKIPAGAARIALAVHLQGQGKAWLDDIEVK